MFRNVARQPSRDRVLQAVKYQVLFPDHAGIARRHAVWIGNVLSLGRLVKVVAGIATSVTGVTGGVAGRWCVDTAAVGANTGAD